MTLGLKQQTFELIFTLNYKSLCFRHLDCFKEANHGPDAAIPQGLSGTHGFRRHRRAEASLVAPHAVYIDDAVHRQHRTDGILSL